LAWSFLISGWMSRMAIIDFVLRKISGVNTTMISSVSNKMAMP